MTKKIDLGKYKTKKEVIQAKKQMQFELDQESYLNLEAKAKASQMNVDQYMLDLIEKDNKLVMLYLNENDVLLLCRILIARAKMLKLTNEKAEYIQVMKMFHNITRQHETPKICPMCQKPIEIDDLEVQFESDGPKFTHISCITMNDLLDLVKDEENERKSKK
jgi:hypothetical protein